MFETGVLNWLTPVTLPCLAVQPIYFKLPDMGQLTSSTLRLQQ